MPAKTGPTGFFAVYRIITPFLSTRPPPSKISTSSLPKFAIPSSPTGPPSSPPSPASPDDPPPKELVVLVFASTFAFSYRFSRLAPALELPCSLFTSDNRKVASALPHCPRLLNNDPSSPIWPYLSPRFLSSLMCTICYSNSSEAPPIALPEFRSFITYYLQKDPARQLTTLQLLQHSTSFWLSDLLFEFAIAGSPGSPHRRPPWPCHHRTPSCYLPMKPKRPPWVGMKKRREN